MDYSEDVCIKSLRHLLQLTRALSYKLENIMFNRSYITILTGLLSMIIASALFYFDIRSIIAYGLFAVGFLLVGIGILLGFIKMLSEK